MLRSSWGLLLLLSRGGRCLSVARSGRLVYDHQFHMGSPVDTFKHSVLCLLVRRCLEKATPLTYVETHAGRGTYARTTEEALRLREFAEGVDVVASRAAAQEGLHGDIATYLRAQEADPDVYRGSAALATEALRPQDRAVLWERDAACAAALRDSLERLGVSSTCDVRHGDGYKGAARTRVDTRGLVFCDPPFETGSDTDQIASLVATLRVHWRAARIAVWYPHGSDAAAAKRTARLHDAVAAVPDVEALYAHFSVPDAESSRLRSSGVLFVQPPYKLEDDLNTMLPDLAALLGGDSSGVQVRWLGAPGARVRTRAAMRR